MPVLCKGLNTHAGAQEFLAKQTLAFVRMRIVKWMLTFVHHIDVAGAYDS